MIHNLLGIFSHEIAKFAELHLVFAACMSKWNRGQLMAENYQSKDVRSRTDVGVRSGDAMGRRMPSP